MSCNYFMVVKEKGINIQYPIGKSNQEMLFRLYYLALFPLVEKMKTLPEKIKKKMIDFKKKLEDHYREQRHHIFKEETQSIVKFIENIRINANDFKKAVFPNNFKCEFANNWRIDPSSCETVLTWAQTDLNYKIIEKETYDEIIKISKSFIRRENQLKDQFADIYIKGNYIAKRTELSMKDIKIFFNCIIQELNGYIENEDNKILPLDKFMERFKKSEKETTRDIIKNFLPWPTEGIMLGTLICISDSGCD